MVSGIATLTFSATFSGVTLYVRFGCLTARSRTIVPAGGVKFGVIDRARTWCAAPL